MSRVIEPKPLDRALFRTTEDGRIIYFPWGLTHRGYRLPDADAKTPAIRAAAILFGAVLVIATWTAHALQPLLESDEQSFASVATGLGGPVVAMGLVLLGYYLWTSRFVESLPESSFTISREDRMLEAAHLAAPWKVVSVGAVTCLLSSLLILLEADALWLSLMGILVGLGFIWWGLALRRVLKNES